MLPVEPVASPIERELAALDERLRAAQRNGMAAATAAGWIVVVLAALGGWAAI